MNVLTKIILMPLMNFCYKFYTAKKKLLQSRNYFAIIKLNLKSWNIVFFGSDNFSLVSLEELHKNLDKLLINNLEVVTLSNSNPVYKFAHSKGIKIHLWPPNLSGSHDFGVIVSFGKLIPEGMIDIFPLGIINVHASLLPKWRGAMPIVYAIKNGDTTSGITVIKINDKFDTGDVIMKKSCDIGKNELRPSLHNKLAKLGSVCLLEVIHNMPKCLQEIVTQVNDNVSYAPKFSKHISFVRWNEMNALEIFNLYRALYGIYELSTTWHGARVKLLCLSLGSPDGISPYDAEEKKASPGSIEYNSENQCLMVQCKDLPIQVCTIKINDKLYSAKNFWRGILKHKSKTLWRFDS